MDTLSDASIAHPLTREPGALSLSWTVLRALRALNIAYGLAVLGLLIASFAMEDAVMQGLGVRPAVDRERMVIGMRLVAAVGLCAVPLVHRVFTQLLAIVATVRTGDPFVRANARRLRDIAWTVLGLEGLHLLVGVIAANTASSVQSLDIGWKFAFTPVIAVLLLFVLASVFEEGTRMRRDLDGTV